MSRNRSPPPSVMSQQSLPTPEPQMQRSSTDPPKAVPPPHPHPRPARHYAFPSPHAILEADRFDADTDFRAATEYARTSEQAHVNATGHWDSHRAIGAAALMKAPVTGIEIASGIGSGALFLIADALPDVTTLLTAFTAAIVGNRIRRRTERGRRWPLVTR